MGSPITIEGRARMLGDDINTDYIIASTRKRDTLDERVLARFLLETIDPGFAASVRTDDILVAGTNFGCGSAMEIAVTVIQAAGIKAVVAKSFARTFYRNAINNGLVPVECDTSEFAEGDRLRIVFTDRDAFAEDITRGLKRPVTPLPTEMAEILAAGGLVPFVRGGGYGAHAGRGADE